MSAPQLILYHYDGCGFCRRVRSTAEDLGIELKLRNIHQDGDALKELTGARGRATVPVLRIDDADGKSTWMPESRDIIRYLQSLSTP